MKNKWLDNYNDYEVSAPEGFQGDGYSNVGRNSSPAWGGQFQEGGEIPIAQGGTKKPIYVKSKNDPRYKAYQDSLRLYKAYQFQKNNPITSNKQKDLGITNLSSYKPLKMDYEKIEKLLAKEKVLYNKQLNETKKGNYSGKAYKEYAAFSKQNPNINAYTATTVPGFEKRAISGGEDKHVINKSKKVINYYKSLGIKDENINFYTSPDVYDAKIKPISEYYDGYAVSPVYAKPKQNIETLLDLPIQNNLQPAGLVYPDNDIEADPNIRVPVRTPKYYDVTDTVNQNFGGTESKYKYYPENGDLPNIAPSPYNTRTAIPHYQMGGSVYPVNYVPEAQTGGSFPGATGFSYARTGSIPSKGPRRNQTDKTDASAQNGKEMQYYQQGLDWKPKTISRDGSVIKDDMGYWNPDNWGKVVEIGSTDITMEGVYEPLLGISDTGDTKLMKPGKNYKFKGKKVTEYPMAKNGVNQQDQKTLQQLDQLTNFTNYNKPQPGGWLNKYN
jgi:hypothetical protein